MNEQLKNGRIPGSFRDPSGFVFHRSGTIHRQVNDVYSHDYRLLMDSGLYDALIADGRLVAHQELDPSEFGSLGAFKILRPDPIPFVSYPYEWCFSQLKQAALLTLSVQEKALDFGMSLKDASAYNVQFRGCQPLLIDTLSFERYREGTPWVAYRQFCQHFLAPLALMAHVDVRLGLLLREHIDGLPLDLVSKLLPFRSKFKFSVLVHLHLHAKAQAHYSDAGNMDGKGPQSKLAGQKVSLKALRNLLDSLRSAVSTLEWRPTGTEWGDYYNWTNYSDAAFARKQELVNTFLDAASPANVWDFGGNIGLFSRLSSCRGIPTVSFDIDAAAVEKNFRVGFEQQERCLLPLLLDLTNPSPSIGWENQERNDIWARGPADTVLALALIHHLSIGNNVPLKRVAQCFHSACRTLIIEFVPKEDSQVKRLLSSREDIFDDYTIDGFESAFGEFFTIRDKWQIEGTYRTLYRMDALSRP